MQLNVTVNEDQRLFVIQSQGGYSCLGFQVVEDYIAELTRRLQSRRIPVAPESGPIGSVQRYELYSELLKKYAGTADTTTWFSPRTPRTLQQLLETLRKDRRQVRLFYGCPDTGLDSLQEHDTVGHIGRSGGVMRSPILVPSGDVGGSIIASDRIVKIVNPLDGEVLYAHKHYHLPDFEIRTAEAACCVEVYVQGALFARFDSVEQACEWVSFMAGKHHLRVSYEG